MVTDLNRVNVHANRVLGAVDFSTRLLDFLEDSILRTNKIKFTGPSAAADRGGFFTTVTMSDGSGSNMLDIAGGSGGIYGTDGTGEVIALTNGDSRINEVPFPDAGATTYHLGFKVVEVPSGMSQDTVTGTVYYDKHRKDVGFKAEPSAAAASGAGIQFTLANHKQNVADSFTGRTAICYLKNPVSNSPTVAIETVTISGTTATTAGKLGQTVVSTTASDYEVILLGPMVTLQDISAVAGWAYVGSVVGGGAPRTFNHSAQVALISQEETSIFLDRTAPKGWVNTKPTISNTSNSFSVTSTGTLLINGRAVSTPTSGPHGSLTANSDIFLSYDAGTSSWVVSTTWDNANSTNRVPLIYAKTDGSSNLLAIANIGKLVEEYPETLTLSVSDDVAQRGAFRSLREALACAVALRKGSTLAPRGIVIEVIGDITVSAEINDHELFPAAVTIRGRGPSIYSAGGSRIIYSATTGAIFHLNDAAAAINGWAFEDLTFRITGVNTEASSAIVRMSNGSINGLAFRRCFVDGNGALSGSGGASGKVAHALYVDGGATLTGLRFEGCEIRTTDTLIRNLSAGPTFGTLDVIDTTYVAAGTVIGSVEGGVLNEDSGESSPWFFDHVTMTTRGSWIRADNPDKIRIRDCDFTSDSAVDHKGLRISSPTNLWVSGSSFSKTMSGGSAAEAVISVTGGGLGVISIDGNKIAGDDGTEAGVLIDGSSEINGVMIRNNLIGGVVGKVGIGVHLDGASASIIGAIVRGNWIKAGTCLKISAYRTIIAENYLDHSTLGMDLDGETGAEISAVVVGNITWDNGGNALDLDGDDFIFVGNGLTETSTITGDRNILIGNNTNPLTIDTSGDNMIAVGNNFSNFTATVGSGHVLVGNWVGTFVEPVAGQTDIILVGNRVDATNALIFENTRGAIVGNILDTTDLQLGASSSDIVLVANWAGDASITNSGATNVVADNAS